MLTWGVGIAFNDRFLWSQWLWWIPTAPAAIAAVVALIGSRLLDRHAARTLRRLALGATALVLVALATEARPHGLLLGSTPDPNAPTISVAYWNLSWAEPAPAARAIAEGRLDADVLVIANPRPGRTELANVIADRYAAPPPADPLAADTGPSFIARVNFTTIASRYPIRAHGRAALTGFKTSWSKARLSNAEAGVIFVELDHPGAGTVTLWIVDLPSDPMVSRPALTARMASDIANWNRRVTRSDGIGRWRTQPDETRIAFPTPDIIVGDFNTPRGSHSLRALIGQAIDAHAAVGTGFAHTWPRPIPLWAIDLAFVHVRTATPIAFDAIDTGHSFHHAIRVTAALNIAPNVTPEQTSGPPTASPPDP
ncbi:MAG: endonuclease/exonuclease/phosphatase family protein [Planctomycetota bacterium]